ncbi:hypothetical protein TNCT_67181 [Trichonephila clavata]|uniref:Uncharacterized protein n=1 Tax=Trichonephila clavata TaxID=2740835 RepID=A0A8X6LYP0_TRICU|nr:hypothetical protein TNCT_67181 [Trichonephila clavata]
MTEERDDTGRGGCALRARLLCCVTNCGFLSFQGPSNCEDVASETTAPAPSRHPGPTQQSSRARCLGVDAY